MYAILRSFIGCLIDQPGFHRMSRRKALKVRLLGNLGRTSKARRIISMEYENLPKNAWRVIQATWRGFSTSGRASNWKKCISTSRISSVRKSVKTRPFQSAPQHESFVLRCFIRTWNFGNLHPSNPPVDSNHQPSHQSRNSSRSSVESVSLDGDFSTFSWRVCPLKGETYEILWTSQSSKIHRNSFSVFL